MILSDQEVERDTFEHGDEDIENSQRPTPPTGYPHPTHPPPTWYPHPTHLLDLEQLDQDIVNNQRRVIRSYRSK